MLDCKAEATALLSEFFFEGLKSQRLSLRDFEEFAVQEGTKILREAMENSLEKLDDKLFNEREHDFSVKEVKSGLVSAWTHYQKMRKFCDPH